MATGTSSSPERWARPSAGSMMSVIAHDSAPEQHGLAWLYAQVPQQ